MLFDDVLKNPVLKKVLAAGEEQAGRVVTRLLASERVTSGLQGLLGVASVARATLEAGVQGALRAANLPSAGQVEALKQKIDELEAVVDDLTSRLDEPPRGAPPPGPPPEASR